MFFVWKACPGVCKIWRKQEKLFRFDSNLCISSGLFLKLNFNDFYSWQEKSMGWTVACWFSYEPQVYGAGPCHQLPNGGLGAVALATIFWFKYFQGLSTLGYNPFSCRTKRWHANRLAFPSWSSRVFPSACVCSPLSPVYLAECGKKHFTCPLIFHWTKKHNSAYPQIYFPGKSKPVEKNPWWFLHINGSASVKTIFFAWENWIKDGPIFSNHVTEKRNLSLQNILILFFKKKEQHFSSPPAKSTASIEGFFAQRCSIISNSRQFLIWPSMAGEKISIDFFQLHRKKSSGSITNI